MVFRYDVGFMPPWYTHRLIFDNVAPPDQTGTGETSLTAVRTESLSIIAKGLGIWDSGNRFDRKGS